MITKLTIRNNSVFLYLTQAMLQLLHVVPENAYFLFTLKDKILYITEAKGKEKKSSYASKIRKTGSGWGIYMSKSLLEFLEINPETDSINVEIQNETLILKTAGKC